MKFQGYTMASYSANTILFCVLVFAIAPIFIPCVPSGCLSCHS